MNVPLISEMLRLFHEGVARYQPVLAGFDLEEETGDPAVSTHNLARLLEGDMFVNHIMIRPCTVLCEDDPQACSIIECRSLIVFNTAANYLALGFSLANAAKRKALTKFATNIGYGAYPELKKFYDAVGKALPDFQGVLPPAGVLVTPNQTRRHP